MQTDCAGHTIPVINPGTDCAHSVQVFVAVLGASNYTFAWASPSQRLPDGIEAQVRALKFVGAIHPWFKPDGERHPVRRATSEPEHHLFPADGHRHDLRGQRD